MTFKIQKFIRDEIKIQRLEELLREYKIPSRTTAPDKLELFENAVNNNINNINEDVANSFIENEIKYGERRFVYITKFESYDQKKLKDLNHIKMLLKSLDNSISTNVSKINLFNETTLNSYAHLQSKDDHLEFFQINMDATSTSVESVELCLTKLERIFTDDTISYYKSYIWIDIKVTENVICFRVPSSGYHFGKPIQANQAFNYYFNLIRQKALITFEDMQDYKEVLYKISKDLFEIAEKPFLQRFIDAKIPTPRIMSIAKQYNMFAESSSLELFEGRLDDLIERIIIHENFLEYMSSAEGKDGIILKIEFTDATGASVRANAGTKKDDHLELCDIFFDTRKTLSDQSTIDQVLIRWFIPEEVSSKSEVTCRFFIGLHYISVNFQYINLTKEHSC